MSRGLVIVSAASVVIDARVAALLAPAAGELVRAARVRGPVDPALAAVAEELDEVRRIVAAFGNPIADPSPVDAGPLDDEPMTVSVASKRYGTPERTLRHQCAQGRLGRREAGRWIVFTSEMEAM